MDNHEPNQQESRDSSDVVSFDDEPLILVDEHDREVGFLDKASAHLGQGVLHRAFSLFVFNPQGDLLLQQRASGKRLWPGFWSNTCCSHPRRGETMEKAIHRRLNEELGLQCPLQFLFKFEYQAQFDAEGAEHELCGVYAGRSAARPTVNVNEISALRYISPDALDTEMKARPQTFTPWFKIEWERLRREHPQVFAPLPVESA
ncbi:isopentenyl-diphosphate Delta-isomerase [Rhodanobacter sp. MP7CTX1]|uniref:isopentenyl-diphosphate Delta-isomerase n=1 Tax=Rhodanobacter sp. MP7CTX1 TaxID=2723084 RepID=UPI0018209567|nr:isopentenyl-diphosphate Delta-isomerase [Rhodanobacter sp. MP7CTX1]MBB6188423.1 isopentenyl-diphosphate delta-isomerase [Rhodanobacter sp. MP7CTX1]